MALLDATLVLPALLFEQQTCAATVLREAGV